MSEQQFLRSRLSIVTQPPLPNPPAWPKPNPVLENLKLRRGEGPNRTGIKISWGEMVAKTIEIRHRHIGMVTNVDCNNPAGAGRDWWQGQETGHDQKNWFEAEQQLRNT